jgi:hypothetical protein
MNGNTEQMVRLISQAMDRNPSPHLYALRTAWLEFGDLVGYYYGDETCGVVSPIGHDLWYEFYNAVYESSLRNSRKLEEINKRNKLLHENADI